MRARRADELQLRLVRCNCAPGTRLGLLSLLAQLPGLAPGEAANAAKATPGAPPPAHRGPPDGGAHAPAGQRAWGRSGALAQPAGGSGGRGQSRLAEAGPRTDFEARPASCSALHGLISYNLSSHLLREVVVAQRHGTLQAGYGKCPRA